MSDNAIPKQLEGVSPSTLLSRPVPDASGRGMQAITLPRVVTLALEEFTPSLSSPMAPMSPGVDFNFKAATVSDNVADADIVDYLLECAKDLPDITSLVQSARISFTIIEPWRLENPPSNHPVVVAIVTDMNFVANKFIKTLEMTVRNAGNGFALANDTIALCESLNVYPAADVLGFVEEIRPKAQQAYGEALDTSNVFESVRQELLEIIRRIQSESTQIQTDNDLVLLPHVPEDACVRPTQRGKKNGEMSDRRMQQYSVTAVIELLRKANEDMGNLVTCVSAFASWCSKTETMLLSLMMKVEESGFRNLDPLRAEAVRKCWEGVSEEYLQYRTSIGALRDFYTSNNDHSAYTIKGNVPKVFLQLLSPLVVPGSLRKNRALVSTGSRDLPKGFKSGHADRNEEWERTKKRVATVATSILGTAAVTAHEALSFSVQVLPFVPVPGLVPAANLLLTIWDSLQLVERNDSAFLLIAERCADILFSVRTEIATAGKDVESEIGDCFKKLAIDFRAVETCFQKYIQRPFHKRYFERDQISRDIAACHASLNGFLVLFGLSMQIHALKQQTNTARQQAETAHQLTEITNSLADAKNLLQSISLLLAEKTQSSSSLHQSLLPGSITNNLSCRDTRP